MSDDGLRWMVTTFSVEAVDSPERPPDPTPIHKRHLSVLSGQFVDVTCWASSPASAFLSKKHLVRLLWESGRLVVELAPGADIEIRRG